MNRLTEAIEIKFPKKNENEKSSGEKLYKSVKQIEIMS